MIRWVEKDDLRSVVIPAMLGMIGTDGYKDIEPDPEYVERMLDAMQAHPHSIILADYSTSGDVRGVILGVISPVWYTASFRAVQEMLYVHTEFRGGSVAMRLLRAFEQEATQLGADSFVIGMSSGENTVGFEKLAKRLGYSSFSNTYKKER